MKNIHWQTALVAVIVATAILGGYHILHSKGVL